MNTKPCIPPGPEVQNTVPAQQEPHHLRLRGEALERLARGAPLEEVLQVIARGIDAQIPGATCGVMLLSTDGRHLRTIVPPRLPDFYNLAVDGLAIGDGVASCGTAAHRGCRVLIDDVASHPYWTAYRDLAQQAGIIACWSDPIPGPNGRPVGTFAIYHKQPTHAEECHLDALDFGARLASVAILHHLQASALRNSQALLRTVIDEFPGIIALKDVQGRFVLGNRGAAELYATTPEELLGQDDSAFNANVEQLAAFRADVQEIISSGQTLRATETSTDARTGQIRHLQSIKKPVQGAHGEPLALIIATDTTDLEETRSSLARSRKHLDHVFAAIGEGVWDWDLVGDRITHNRRWCEMLELSEAYLSHGAIEFFALIHPDDRARVQEDIERCLGGEGPYHSEHRMLCGEGRPIWVRDRGDVIERASDGRPLRLMGSIADISIEMDAQQYLRLTASVFRHAHEAIVITDIDAHILDVNDTFCSNSGYTREEIIGQHTRLLRSGEQNDAFYASMWASLHREGVWHGELWNRKKNGELYAQLGNISAVRNEAGETTHYVGLFSDITALKESQRHLEHLAYHDALTQLPNRSLLADRLQMALAQATREFTLTAVAYLDLDGFKPVNDTLGHDAGDLLLIEIARRLQASVRASDTVARLGGDEFALIYNGLEHSGECDQVFERLLARLTEPILLHGREIQVSASIGITLFPEDRSDPDTLLRHADQAMYRAKQAGGNCFHLFDPAQERRLRVHREALTRIENGLAARQFTLHYQPKVDARDDRLVGLEALLRWQDPERGLVLPATFLPLTLGTPVEVELGNWVLETAIDRVAALHAAGHSIPVSINVSPQHLADPGFVPTLSHLLKSHPHLPPGLVELEILESSTLGDIGSLAGIMGACRALGVSFALDDFGTGYASLTYLRRLPVHTIKIDQSFIQDMLEDTDDLAIVQSVIGLAAAFGRQVIAEGVETLAHRDALLALGCHLVQGYGIARPMPGDALEDWIRSHGGGTAS